jgi:hypothetical protein
MGQLSGLEVKAATSKEGVSGSIPIGKNFSESVGIPKLVSILKSNYKYEFRVV